MSDSPKGQSPIDFLEEKFNKKWPHIRAAREAAMSKREEIGRVLGSTEIKFLSMTSAWSFLVPSHATNGREIATSIGVYWWTVRPIQSISQ
jgi:hypothetical protein